MEGGLVKILIFTVNFVLWVCGILLIVFGSIAVANPDSIITVLNLVPGVSNVTNLIDVSSLFAGVSIFMIVLGCLLFLFGAVGCLGAFRMHKRTIMNYWIMLILGVAVEIALIIYAALYPPSLNTYIQESLYTSLIENYQPVNISSTTGAITYSNNITAASWELLQSESHCCGAHGWQDYELDSNFTSWKTPGLPKAAIPPTCCASFLPTGQILTNITDFYSSVKCLEVAPPVENFYYTQGCWINVIAMFWQFDNIAIIISSLLMATQFLGIGLSVHVWHKMVSSDGGI